MVFKTLAHLIDEELLREAYKRTRKDSSPGVDGVTAKEYGANLEANLKQVHERLRKQQYYAPPRSEEHTSELQSHLNLVCRLLLEKKKKIRLSKTRWTATKQYCSYT